MKKLIIIALALAFVLAMVSLAEAVCTTIQDGGLLNDFGDVVTTGYDDWGFNYGAHIFNGQYCDAEHGASWCQPYNNIGLIMKWNDEWLSNMDCNDDGVLDRPSDNGGTYKGSGGWLTNHQAGKVDVNGKLRKWTYFVKIVAVPSDAYQSGGFWYSVEGIEIGPVIWDNFAIVQEVYNDPSVGAHGIQFKSPIGPGLGNLQ